MQTIRLHIGLDFEVTVPQASLDEFRTAAKSEAATEYLKKLDADNPKDDDAFMMALIIDNTRHRLRQYLLHTVEQVGLGCKVSPATVKVQDISDIVEAEVNEAPQRYLSLVPEVNDATEEA